jgi:hypothetical protein
MREYLCKTCIQENTQSDFFHQAKSIDEAIKSLQKAVRLPKILEHQQMVDQWEIHFEKEREMHKTIKQSLIAFINKKF